MGTLNSLYIHFPFCRHICNYCDFYKSVPKDRFEITSFHKIFEESFKVHEGLLKEHGFSWSPLETLYIGGGTPSLWGVEGAEFLRDFLKSKNIAYEKDIEFTLEVNPGSWTQESLSEWKKTGVNRFSLGIQTLNPKCIKYLDRVHSLQDTYETLEYFSKNGENFSVDFMLGIPNSSDRKVLSELENVLKYKPGHLSLYILTTKENYIHKDQLPCEEQIEKEYLEVSQYLSDRGFNHYEVSNYALPGKKSHHNLKYWKGESVGAIGPSATGFLSLGEKGIRYKWENKAPKFNVEILGEEEFKLERLYTLLRTDIGIDGLNFFKDKNSWEKLLEIWESRGYLRSKKGPTVLNSKGFLLLDSLMDDIFQIT